MDEMHYWELGLMFGNNSGGKASCNMLELIDNMPTLYTYSVGDFTFDFKIEDFYDYIFSDIDMFTLPSSDDDVYHLESPIWADWICKKNGNIICASRENMYNKLNGSQEITYDTNGNVVYISKISEVNISDVSVSLPYNFKISVSYKYDAENFYTGYKVSQNYKSSANMYLFNGGRGNTQSYIFNGCDFDTYKFFYEVSKVIQAAQDS